MLGLEERVPIEEVMDLIQVGGPLPFKVLDLQARLLLNEGQLIANERQFDLLVARGAWVDRQCVLARRGQAAGLLATGRAPVERLFNLFDRWERQLWDLDALLRSTARGVPTGDQWSALVHDLIATVDRDVDIALYGAVRQEDQRFALYPLAHALHVAVLCLLAARQAGWTAQRQGSLVAAALSMNVAMMELQALMAEQDEPPRPRQLEQIRAHPMQAVQTLRQAGISDMVWLRAVAEHHEHDDGSGYPRGVTALCDEARLLRMADVYMAKITPRAKRPPLAPVVASRQLFQQAAGSVLALHLIKAIGVHPPGCLVQLKSGEVGVVKRRPASGTAPLVFVLSDRLGEPIASATTLDTALPEHQIIGPCEDASLFGRIPGERVYGVVPA